MKKAVAIRSASAATRVPLPLSTPSQSPLSPSPPNAHRSLFGAISSYCDDPWLCETAHVTQIAHVPRRPHETTVLSHGCRKSSVRGPRELTSTAVTVFAARHRLNVEITACRRLRTRNRIRGRLSAACERRRWPSWPPRATLTITLSEPFSGKPRSLYTSVFR